MVTALEPDPSAKVYVSAWPKTSNCSSDCTWYSDQVVPSIHGQWVAQNSSLSTQSYTYDAAGRLTWTYDTTFPSPSGTTCVTRQYTYDGDSNRTSVTSKNPNSCLMP